MPNTIIEEIPRLQRLAKKLGIEGIAIHPGKAKSFSDHEIVIDWNGGEETYYSANHAAWALRDAAK